MFKRKGYRKLKRRLTLGGIPDAVTVKLRYAKKIKFSGTVGDGTYQAYRANGIYDPEVALGGHQPMGRDRYASMYNHYVVLGSKASFTYNMANSSANYGNYGRVVGMVLDDNGTFDTGTTAETIIENGHGKWKVHNTGHADPNIPKRITTYYSAKKFFSVKDVLDNKNWLGSNIGSDPLDQAYYLLYTIPVNDYPADQTTYYINGMLVIDYIVQFYERQEQFEN